MYWALRTSSSTSVLSPPLSPSSISSKNPCKQSCPPKAARLSHHARGVARSVAALLAGSLLLLYSVGNVSRAGLGTFGTVPTATLYRSTEDISALPLLARRPLTALGFEADLVYSNIGSTDIDEYRIELEQFLHRSFPAQDTDTSDPNSMLNILKEFLPAPTLDHEPLLPQTAFRRMLLLPFQTVFDIAHWYIRSTPLSPPLLREASRIPKKIHQTSWFPGPDPPDDKQPPESWRSQNPDYEYRYSDNDAARDFMSRRFNRTDSDRRNDAGHGVAETYSKMQDVPVMQSDFWRYAVLASEGGVYSDLDTRCLKPIDGWHGFSWQRELSSRNESRARPSLIVGIEVDVEDSRKDKWHRWWPRPLAFVQWTMASTRGHPVLIDTMRRVTEAVNAGEGDAVLAGLERDPHYIVETSGPGAFTDSVLRYLGAKYNVTWPALRNLSNEGILFTDKDGHADVLVLSITAFSPGVGNFGAGDVFHAAALVQHMFSGSWKASHR